MKTKEQIALEYGLCTCDEAYTSRKLHAPDCPWHSMAVEEAMEEYAKQQAIAFMEFSIQKSSLGLIASKFYHSKSVQEQYDIFIDETTE